MAWRFKTLLTLSILSAAIPASAASEPIWLQPSAKWELRIEEHRCSLIRFYGDGFGLMLIRYPSGDRNLIRISGPKRWVSVRSSRTRITLWSDPQEKAPQPRDTLIFDMAGDDGPIVQAPVDHGFFADMERVRQLHFDLPGNPERIFALPGISAALEAQKNCNNKLLSSWGIDPDVLANLKSRPKRIGYWENLIDIDDFPEILALRRDGGEVTMRFTVGTDGIPRECVVMASSGSEKVDKLTCRLLEQRARYEPAIDQNGRAVSVMISETVIWLV